MSTDTPMAAAAKPTLDDILSAVRADLAVRRREKTLRKQMGLASKRKDYRDFGRAIRRVGGKGINWIGEVKKASPSAGLLRPQYDPVVLAQIYEQKGASAVSVLTEQTYFQGSLQDLADVHANVALPVLRRDFIVEEYQIVEAAACGADAVLLITSLLDYKQLEKFIRMAGDQNMASLTEVHTLDDLNKALDAGALILGINNRNLATLEVDLSVTERLYSHIPRGMIAVTESGYKEREEIITVEKMGLDALLIGETLLRSEDLPASIATLFGGV